jgi:hypothetical protein
MNTHHEATRRPAHRPAPHSRIGGLGPDLNSLADVVERLYTEFESRLGLPVVITTVRHCRRELDITHGPALPELLERLARQRLHDIITRPNEQARRPQ